MQPTLKNHARRWKLGLALLMATFQIGLVASLVIASRRVGPVTDTEYYNNGLHYGQTSTGARNPGLRWTMSASLAGGELQVQVRDATGAPVSGGKLSFEPKRTGTGPGSALTLAESAPGFFRAPRPVTPQWELHGTLRFHKGEALASQKLVFLN